jgi:CheY-like chemotaxis protein
MVEILRIVIAEDAAVIRAGLTEVLTDRGHEIVAAVGDAEALQAAVAEHKPDVAIVDVRMPPDHTPTRGCAPRSRSVATIPAPASWCSPSTWRPGTPPTW